MDTSLKVKWGPTHVVISNQNWDGRTLWVLTLDRHLVWWD